MADGIDKSLDDIMNSSSSAARRRFSVNGPDRRFFVRNPVRTTPYPIPHGREAWRRSMVPEMVLDDGGAPQPEREPGTKLYLSNLDYDVSNQDIKLLFSEMGELKRYSIHYDRSGRSKGTAEVVFIRQSDALAAIKKYNNMKLDGKPLQIELVGTSLVTPAVMPHGQSCLLGRQNNFFIREQGPVLSSWYPNSFASGYLLPRGRGEEKGHFQRVPFRDPDQGLERDHRPPRGRRGVQGCHVPEVSVKELDDDLERYRTEGMLIDRKKAKAKGNHV